MLIDKTLYPNIIGFGAAVLAGIAFMLLGGAPAHYPAINAAAFATGVVLLLLLSPAITNRAVTIIVFAASLALFLPLIIGPDLEGIHRWIALGPVQLHAGMFLLPLVMALLPRLNPKAQNAAFLCAAIAISAQPDRASAMALLGGAFGMAVVQRDRWAGVSVAIALLSVSVTFVRADPLDPVPFVETVLPDAWAIHPLIANVLVLTLIAAIALPVRQGGEMWSLAGAWAGFAFASFIGAYPTPLIGYGAAPIIGFALGLAMCKPRSPTMAKKGN
jgi:cell division protein FtsW (lipid II flippase)